MAKRRRAERDVTGVLEALARGALGEGYVDEVPGRMRDKLVDFPPAERKKLLGVLRQLDTPRGALALTGKRTPVSGLSAEQAERLVQAWLRSRLPAKRQLAKALIALATASVYGFPGREWDRIGYPGPLPVAGTAEPPKLNFVEITEPEQLKCDVVVVGSGAGGGCVAAGLAKAGLDVVVLEKGGFRPESSFDHLEAGSVSDMYLYGATLASSDLSVLIIAGSTLGGGTVVNYTTSFHTPDFVLREWARQTGIPAFADGEFAESLDEVAARVNVNRDSSAPGRRDELMEEGLQKLGWDVDTLPRAVRGCTQDDQCGYCGFGCRVGAKQSTARSFLQDASAAGTRILLNADVRKVFARDGKAHGVGAYVNGHQVHVRSRAVVVAAGSIETPALLLRSKLGGQVGRYLRLHPGFATFGVFDEDVRMWTGTLQSRYSRHLRDRDGGYGPIFETVPVHPGLGSGAMPWVSAAQHRELMGKFGRLGFCAVLPRDRTAGRVTINRDGSPRVRYRLSKDDEGRIVDGLIAAGKVVEAAGARELFTLHTPPLSYRPAPGAHDRWAMELRAAGLRGRVTGVSFHQMGSCRMGTDPATSAIGPENETHEVRNLYVTDASAFPTASGVNPMLTIYGIANRAAKKIAARLA
ncbi:MAG: GMC family oxidoreductase N-terminal domain-containing protein [Actinomycetota bacterium]